LGARRVALRLGSLSTETRPASNRQDRFYTCSKHTCSQSTCCCIQMMTFVWLCVCHMQMIGCFASAAHTVQLEAIIIAGPTSLEACLNSCQLTYACV
jgi:hypothetical protein